MHFVSWLGIVAIGMILFSTWLDMGLKDFILLLITLAIAIPGAFLLQSAAYVISVESTALPSRKTIGIELVKCSPIPCLLVRWVVSIFCLILRI